MRPTLPTSQLNDVVDFHSGKPCEGLPRSVPSREIGTTSVPSATNSVNSNRWLVFDWMLNWPHSVSGETQLMLKSTASVSMPPTLSSGLVMPRTAPVAERVIVPHAAGSPVSAQRFMTPAELRAWIAFSISIRAQLISNVTPSLQFVSSRNVGRQTMPALMLSLVSGCSAVLPKVNTGSWSLRCR